MAEGQKPKKKNSNLRLLLILAVFVIGLLACVASQIRDGGEGSSRQATSPPGNPVVKSTDWLVVVGCPKCRGIPLTLWQQIDDIGTSPGKVDHGSTCIVLDQGVIDGVEKYQLDCDGKIGWLRAEVVKPA
jgi:hypothetical protein